MTLVTLEVEIDHGRVIAHGSELLPERARGLLTLLPEARQVVPRRSVSEFIGKWAGAFSLPPSLEDDPRLAFLVEKHLK